MKLPRFISYLCTALVFAAPAFPRNVAPPDTSSNGLKVTIEGLVRDLACPIQNDAATATEFNLRCARDCARQGSPLIILARDGKIYIPISDSMPDKNQRQRLMPFVGKFVQASGTLFQRNGTRAIAISEIKEMRKVHLITDAK
ncbi:MAG: hypothetical protein ACRD4H_01100 [Candidatus Acidiferrales bacterium]